MIRLSLMRLSLVVTAIVAEILLPNAAMIIVLAAIGITGRYLVLEQLKYTRRVRQQAIIDSFVAVVKKQVAGRVSAGCPQKLQPAAKSPAAARETVKLQMQLEAQHQDQPAV